jgi:hypothetical protein
MSHYFDRWVWYGQMLFAAGEPVAIDTTSRRVRDQGMYAGAMIQIFAPTH